MFIEEIDKFKDLMGINDLIGCVYIILLMKIDLIEVMK